MRDMRFVAQWQVKMRAGFCTMKHIRKGAVGRVNAFYLYLSEYAEALYFRGTHLC